MQKGSKYLATLDLNNWAVTLLYLFLATDISFIILHLVYSHHSSLIPSESIPATVFSLETDRGYSEIFQYVKEYWIALLLGLLAVRNRSLLYLSWSLLFGYILLDDAAELHERLGFLIGKQFGFVTLFHLRATDFGGLLVSASVGLFFLIAIAITYRQSDRPARKVSKKLTLLLLALVFFGIAIDMLHVTLQTSFLDSLLIVLEDGGELMVMSLIAGFVFSKSTTQKAEQSVKQREFARHF